MIRKLVRQMLTAQIFSALTVSVCLLIDSVMISRYLGEEATAAYGLANPILLAIVWRKWKSRELNYLKAMDELNVSMSTFYRLMKRRDNNKKR